MAAAAAAEEALSEAAAAAGTRSTAAAADGDLAFVARIAGALGADENAVRILISLVLGYPLASCYRYFFYGKVPYLQHLFFTLCGLWMCYFNFGIDAVHSIANISVIYVILLLCGGTKLSIILTFLFNMAYLMIGYYVTMMDSYTIKWTTPHCVLTLRLIGLVFDVYDGRKQKASLSSEQNETALDTTPTFLEICGHCYFFGGFLVGPQFPMKRYQDFVHERFTETTKGSKPRSISPAMLRLLAGVSYTLVFQLGSLFCPDSLLLSDGFSEMYFVQKCIVIAVWGKLTLYKYVGCWLIAEGVCILTGLTYNGKDENGNELWDGCANIHIRQYEAASSCHELIQSFNVNTNKWMAKYIFKRLKFLGSKELSQGVTLAFLALWHGLYSGYFMNFFLEFVIIKFEREAGPVLSNVPVIRLLSSVPGGNLFIWCVKKFYAQFVLGYALVSFCLFTLKRYLLVYSNVYFVGHLMFILLWPSLYHLLLQPSRRRSSQSSRSKSSDTLNSLNHDVTAAKSDDRDDVNNISRHNKLE